MLTDGWLKRRSMFPFALALLVAPVSAAEDVLPVAMELLQCADLALRFNPSLRRVDQQLVEQENVRLVTRAAVLPRVDALGMYGLEDRDRVGSFGGGSEQSDTSWNAGLEAASSLYSGGRLAAELRSQTALEESLRAVRVATENDVLLEVARRYYGAVLAYKSISVQEEEISILEQQLEQARSRFEAGAGPRFDVLQAEVAVANSRPSLVRARNAYRVAIEELRKAIGLPHAPGRDASDVVLQTEWPEAAPLEPVHALVEEALQEHPSLMALNQALLAAEERLISARRQRAPTVQAYANYLFLNDRYSDGDDVLQGWGVGVRASLPIWDSGTIRGRVGQAAAGARQVEFERDEVALALEVEIRRAWFDVEQALEILETADLTVDQAREALRLAENRYRSGALTQLEVLQSQNQVTRSLLARESAAHDVHVAAARLRHARGLPPIP